MTIDFGKIKIISAGITAAFLLTSCTTTKSSIRETTLYDPPKIPEQNFSPSYISKRSDIYHSVSPGETLWRIAKMYDVDVETIKNHNNIDDINDIEIGTRILIPQATTRKHVISLYPNKRWKYIVIHHSASDQGNSMQFNKAHIQRGWQGVGYQFIIDNGTCGKADGQIETTPRWIKQQTGAHCKADGMNYKAIGICLVGNFSDPSNSVSENQLNSLVFLTNVLRKYYKIPKSNIIGHRDAKGAHTECPGKNFPWNEFISRVK